MVVVVTAVVMVMGFGKSRELENLVVMLSWLMASVSFSVLLVEEDDAPSAYIFLD
ncbi:hypothetical protein NL676_008907, partial [Syzygium grande]